jgi:hypothetical protein
MARQWQATRSVTRHLGVWAGWHMFWRQCGVWAYCCNLEAELPHSADDEPLKPLLEHRLPYLVAGVEWVYWAVAARLSYIRRGRAKDPILRSWAPGRGNRPAIYGLRCVCARAAVPIRLLSMH